MRIVKRKCVGGPLNGQEITVADHIEHYRTHKVMESCKVAKTSEPLMGCDFKYFNYKLKSEEFHYTGSDK